MAQTLFLYATREGQTRRVCEVMAEVVQQAGDTTCLLDVSDPAAVPALAKCDSLIIGGSIHYGRLPQALYDFIQKHRDQIEARQNAFFCLNLTARKPGKDTPEGSVYMRTFLKKSPWQPQRLAVFAGALFYTRYTWYDRMAIRFIMWITGGPTDPAQDVEFTDWEKVRAVAREWVKH